MAAQWAIFDNESAAFSLHFYNKLFEKKLDLGTTLLESYKMAAGMISETKSVHRGQPEVQLEDDIEPNHPRKWAGFKLYTTCLATTKT